MSSTIDALRSLEEDGDISLFGENLGVVHVHDEQSP